MGWQTAGILDSPAINTILADTGAISVQATMALCLLVSSQYARRVTVALRDSSNLTDLGTQRIQVGSDDPIVIADIPGIAMGLNQRIVIRTENAVVGDVQASIIW